LLSDFAPVPYQALPYRSVLVASSNDPFCPVRLAGAYARAWGSEFVRMQNAGHINVDSGHGPWPLGVALLESLLGHAPFEGLPATAASTVSSALSA
jgi:predicted alpha/beta hydrolase family esterase